MSLKTTRVLMLKSICPRVTMLSSEEGGVAPIASSDEPAVKAEPGGWIDRKGGSRLGG